MKIVKNVNLESACKIVHEQVGASHVKTLNGDNYTRFERFGEVVARYTGDTDNRLLMY